MRNTALLYTFFCDFIVPEILRQKVANLAKRTRKFNVLINCNNDDITDAAAQNIPHYRQLQASVHFIMNKTCRIIVPIVWHQVVMIMMMMW